MTKQLRERAIGKPCLKCFLPENSELSLKWRVNGGPIERLSTVTMGKSTIWEVPEFSSSIHFNAGLDVLSEL